jgi:hypothetical protein
MRSALPLLALATVFFFAQSDEESFRKLREEMVQTQLAGWRFGPSRSPWPKEQRDHLGLSTGGSGTTAPLWLLRENYRREVALSSRKGQTAHVI